MDLTTQKSVSAPEKKPTDEVVDMLASVDQASETAPISEADIEVELRVRLSERIVKLVICVITKIHARRPGACCCNAHAKNEVIHLVIREHTVNVCRHPRRGGLGGLRR